MSNTHSFVVPYHTLVMVLGNEALAHANAARRTGACTLPSGAILKVEHDDGTLWRVISQADDESDVEPFTRGVIAAQDDRGWFVEALDDAGEYEGRIAGPLSREDAIARMIAYLGLDETAPTFARGDWIRVLSTGEGGSADVMVGREFQIEDVGDPANGEPWIKVAPILDGRRVFQWLYPSEIERI